MQRLQVFTIKWKPVHVAVESVFTIPWKHRSPSRGIRNFSGDFEPYTPGWLSFVDYRGNRFIDETLDYTVVPGVVASLPEHECFAIFDEEARIAAKQHIASSDAKKVYAYSSWSGDMLAQMATRAC